MKEMICKFWIVVCCLFIVSCGKLSNDTTREAVPQINITNGFGRDTSIRISSVGFDYRLIKLEDSKNCFIGDIDRIFLTTNEIVIFDKMNESIFVFDWDGKFIRKIGVKGQGPGEYVSIYFTAFSNLTKEIYLWDGKTHQVIKYSIDGSFIAKRKIETLINDFEVGVDGCCALFTSRKYSFLNDNNSFVLLDENLDLVSQQLHNSEFKKDEYLGSFSLFLEDERLKLWDGYRPDTVFMLCSNRLLKPEYTITHTFEKMSRIEYRNKSLLNQNLHKTMIVDLFESKEYIFIEAIKDRLVHNIVYSKSTKKSYLMKRRSEWMREFCFVDGFVDDVFGGMPFWPKGIVMCGDKEYAFDYSYPFNSKSYLEAKSKNVSSDLVSGSNSLLLKKCYDSNVNANPIITLVQLNSNQKKDEI